MVNGHNGQDGQSVTITVAVEILLGKELVIIPRQRMAEEIVAQI